MAYRRRKFSFVLILALIILGGFGYDLAKKEQDNPNVQSANTVQVASGPALDALSRVPVKGKAPKTGYSRDQFSNGWADAGNCDVRNMILARDMTGVITRSEFDCTVMQGNLHDPYTNKDVMFVRSPEGSDDVQIDHIVALSDAWQTGAQQISPDQRYQFANDTLNLLAVDGPTNQKKGDSDAASWLPPNKDYRCQYIARRIAVRVKYSLWMAPAEYDASKKILSGCPGQLLPEVN